MNPIKKWIAKGFPCPYRDWDLKDSTESNRYKFKIFCGHFRMYHLQLIMRPIRTIRHFFYCLGNVIKWVPVIWNDFDFDYSPIYRILAFKFRKMAYHFEQHGMTIGSPRNARELKLAAALCERISTDTYNNWDGEQFNFPKIGPWMETNERLEFKGANKPPYFYAIYMIEQDLDYLHMLLNKKVRGWWD